MRGFVRGVFWGGVSGIAGLAVVSQLAGSVALQAPIALQNTVGAAQPQSGTAQTGPGGTAQGDDWDKIAPMPLQLGQAVTPPTSDAQAATAVAEGKDSSRTKADLAVAPASALPPAADGSAAPQDSAQLQEQVADAPVPPQAMAAADTKAQVVPVVTPIAPVVAATPPEKLPEVAPDAEPAFAPAVEPAAPVPAVEPAATIAPVEPAATVPAAETAAIAPTVEPAAPSAVAAPAQAPQGGATAASGAQTAGSNLFAGIELSDKAPPAPQGGAQVDPVAAASASVTPVAPREGAAPLGATGAGSGLDDAAQATVPSVLTAGVPLEKSETPAQGQASQPVPLATGGALQRYSRSFANLEQKPLFTILLVDDGADGVDRAGLAGQDVPLTIVIDAAKPGALAHAKIWRAGGQEVVLSGAGLPAGVTGAAYGAALETLAAGMPEAVALVDTDGRTFQNDLGLAAEIVPFLAKSGRGLVTLDQGANPADQSAKREGLPHGRIFRKLDVDGEAAEVVARYLDRAAFKAAQEGRVAVLGHVRPETVAGIMQWAVEGRAASVALAPVSALLAK